MDLRNLPDGLTSPQKCDERLKQIEDELGVDLSALKVNPEKLGHAEEKNCEQMFGHVPIPVGLAGPIFVKFSCEARRSGIASSGLPSPRRLGTDIFLPLATTEGALVASVNRGCKALGTVETKSTHHGMTRSLALKVEGSILELVNALEERHDEWKEVGESTSDHLKILSYDIDKKDDHIFLTIACDTDEAMGMNMVTIASAAIGKWIAENFSNTEFVTVAGNVDSDKKPSKRTHEKGRGYEVIASATLTDDAITSVLKTDPESLLKVARAKLELGSKVAGAIGSNLHAANVIAALYLATGQDAAHVVEGSLADMTINDNMTISVRLPAILVGIRGGGTTLPAQAQALSLLLKPESDLPARQQLAESIGAAVLAGEISLLATQASHSLASAHIDLGR